MERRVKAYLKDLFRKFEPYRISQTDESASKRDLAQFLTHKLLAKRFRKQKVHETTYQDIANKVKGSLEQNIPFHFVIPFGGYKHFWNPSHPEPDWAEVFTLRFLYDWVAPILALHRPGAVIEFISEDMILTRMNNYPPGSLDQYSKAFALLLNTFKKSAPKNLDLRFFRLGEKFDKVEIIKQVEDLLPERWKNWEKYSEQEKQMELKRSVRSVFWNGEKDLTKLSDEEKQRKIIESRLIELAYYDIEAKPEFLGDYYMEQNHIPICFSFGLSPDNSTHWITLGSTYASTVDYWIGRGILEEREDGFINRVVSREQYEKIKDNLKIFETGFGKLPSKNYKTIEVVSQSDWQRSTRT